MTTNLDDAFSGGGAKSAFGKVVQIGQTVGGPIISAKISQAAEFDRDGKPTGKLRTWDNGDPVLEMIVVTQTTQRDPNDPDDDGRRTHRVKTWGDEKKRFNDAVQAAGFQKVSEAMAPGNEFWQKLTNLDGPEGSIKRRDYEYRIIRGSAVAVDQAMGQAEPAYPHQQPAAQAPHTQPLAGPTPGGYPTQAPYQPAPNQGYPPAAQPQNWPQPQQAGPAQPYGPPQGGPGEPPF